ncbi:MAG: hypothetical protein KAS16_05415 [Thermoplasmata archaeon]|nr:hypothetical protein [Thermoplasmata archaeon]
MVTLKGILVHLLQNHGFEVSEKDDILFGEKKDQMVIMGFTDECTTDFVTDMNLRFRDSNSNIIIASMKDPLPGVHDLASSFGITIWDSRDLEEEIGSIIFDHVNAHGGSTILQFSEMVKAELVDPLPGGHQTIAVDQIGKGDSEIIQAPLLHLEDVKEISQKTVKGFKYDLELVPHFLYEYLCIYEGRQGAERKFTGILMVNAYTGISTSIDRVPDLVESIDIPHVRIEPKIDEEEAGRTAISRVILEHTELEDIIIEKEHTIITEKTEFKPTEEEITISLKGIIYVPVWCVEGTNGVMIINAASGKVVSEEYYSKKIE